MKKQFLPSYQGRARKLSAHDIILGKTHKPARYRRQKNRNVFWQDWVRVTAATAALLIFHDTYGLLKLLGVVIIATLITLGLRRYLP